MGYTTEFTGAFSFNKTVDKEMTNFINTFANVRHMTRDNETIKSEFPDWEKLCYKGNLGKDGEFFIGGRGWAGQEQDPSVTDYNRPGGDCPGLWCQWVIEENELKWDGGEKFYKYVKWLKYLIKNFFAPNGYVLSGTVEFQGEDEDDHGYINIMDNNVSVTDSDETVRSESDK